MSTGLVTSEMVLALLRQLSPHERLHVVMQVLPELEQELPSQPMTASFWQGMDAQQLAEQQKVKPIQDFGALLGGWPDDESVDDFITAVSHWREQNLAQMPAR